MNKASVRNLLVVHFFIYLEDLLENNKIFFMFVILMLFFYFLDL